MAGFASLALHRRMLEDERSALVGVTAQAGLLIGVLLEHAGPRSGARRRSERAVRIVAIRALHESLVHPVLDRHVELRANIGMTGVTKIHLLLGQKELWRRSLVDRMAV